MIVASRQVKAYFTDPLRAARGGGGMTSKWRKAIAILFACMVAGAFSAPALSAPDPHKCNAGNGNASETTPETDCDPGNSGGRNNGGD
jgi:hypothetical protein